MKLIIDPDGTMHGLESSVTQLLGLRDRRRVSHIEPVNPLLRRLFHAVRQRVSDKSRWAEFTRRWPCCWQARIFDGPVLGPFRSRKEALAAEVQYIQRQMETAAYE